MSAKRSTTTGDLILDAAERRVETRGFNGFSYGDVAGELGVTTAAIHYHFNAKSDLGAELTDRYTGKFLKAVDDIGAKHQGAREQLVAYAKLYEDMIADGRLCLGCVLAAEYETLPAQMRERVAAFFAEHEQWLIEVLLRGHERGEITLEGDVRDAAFTFIGGLQGAMLVARMHGGVARFRAGARLLLARLFDPR